MWVWVWACVRCEGRSSRAIHGREGPRRVLLPPPHLRETQVKAEVEVKVEVELEAPSEVKGLV